MEEFDMFGGMSVPAAIPEITGPFTNWNYRSMRNMVDFCKLHDPYPPNFIGQLIDEGKIRTSVADNHENLTSDELEIIEQKKDLFYRKEWSRVILQIIPYKKPLVPNVEQMSAYSAEIDPT